jgi:hypothetical protein
MTPKTHFSFELQYPAPTESGAAAAPGQDDMAQAMASLEPTLQALFSARDPAASVKVSDAHQVSSPKYLELVTTLPDADIASILKEFSERHGVTVNALE